MKKGCFFTVFVILTIIIAVFIYLFRNYKDEAYAFFKPMILNSIKNEYNEAIEKQKITANKDSLVSIVNSYIDHTRNKGTFRMEQLEHFFNRFQLVIEDGTVDSTELALLKNIFEEEKKNERSEKNRN